MVAHFEDSLKAEFRGDTVEVLEDLVYWSESGERYVVPKGFVCDLGSVPALIPGFLRLFFGGTVSTAAASCLHDWLYKQGKLSRMRCDALFFEALRATEESTAGAWVQYLGVRIGGWLPWRSHRKAKENSNAQGQEGKG